MGKEADCLSQKKERELEAVRGDEDSDLDPEKKMAGGKDVGKKADTYER